MDEDNKCNKENNDDLEDGRDMIHCEWKDEKNKCVFCSPGFYLFEEKCKKNEDLDLGWRKNSTPWYL